MCHLQYPDWVSWPYIWT